MWNFIYGFIAGVGIASVAAWWIGRKPKIIAAAPTEASKLTGK